MIEIKITTENAAEMHEELSQLLFGVKAQPREVVKTEAPVPGPGEKLVRGLYEKEAKIVKDEEVEETPAETPAPVEEVKEPVKRKSRAKKVEEPKEEEPVKEEETKEEEAAPDEKPTEETKEEEAKAEAPAGEVTLAELRKLIGELNKDPEKAVEMKKHFAKQKVKNVLDLSPAQIADFYNDIKDL